MRCAAPSADTYRPSVPSPEAIGSHQSANSAKFMKMVIASSRMSVKPTSSHKAANSPGLVSGAGEGVSPQPVSRRVEQGGGVEEDALRDHAAAAGPNGGGNDTARPGDASHFAHRIARVWDELQHQLRQDAVERGVRERDSAGIALQHGPIRMARPGRRQIERGTRRSRSGRALPGRSTDGAAGCRCRNRHRARHRPGQARRMRRSPRPNGGSSGPCCAHRRRDLAR